MSSIKILGNVSKISLFLLSWNLKCGEGFQKNLLHNLWTNPLVILNIFNNLNLQSTDFTTKFLSSRKFRNYSKVSYALYLVGPTIAIFLFGISERGLDMELPINVSFFLISIKSEYWFSIPWNLSSLKHFIKPVGFTGLVCAFPLHRTNQYLKILNH